MRDERGLTTLEYIIGAAVTWSFSPRGDGLEQWTGGQDQSAGPTAHGDVVNRRTLWRRLRDEAADRRP